MYGPNQDREVYTGLGAGPLVVGAASAVVKGVTGIFGGGKDHRADSLKVLQRAVKSGDVATLQRKAASSRYVKVRREAAAALTALGLPVPSPVGAPAESGPDDSIGPVSLPSSGQVGTWAMVGGAALLALLVWRRRR